MIATDVTWPKKTRELRTLHLDSTIWNDFKFRDDDIIIATYGKSGTTWMQQIISQMLFAGDTDVDTQAMSPWVDYVIPPKEVKLPALEAQTHRRFVKTHLPVDALVYSPKAKYIYIGRDGRDVLWSFHNHHANGTEVMYNGLNNRPGRVGPPLEPPPADIREYWRDWMDRDGYPYWSLWENVRSWWAIRHLPNILMALYDVLRKQMPEQMRRIAGFLGIPIDESVGCHRRALHLQLDAGTWRKNCSLARGAVGGWHENVSKQGHQRAVARYPDCGGIGGIRGKSVGRTRARMCSLACDRRGRRG